MVKRTQSIDGFVPRATRTVAATKQSPTSAPTTTRRVVNDPEQQLLNDIEASLNQIDDITPPESQANGRHQRRAARKQQLSTGSKKPKKKLTKGKVIKRIVILLIVIILAVVGYIAVKAFLAGGKVFNGNPLDMLTTKTRLAEDDNGRTNVLIFGTSGYTMDEDAWDGAMLTDSIMVVSLDQDNNDVYMISLPRDLYVKNNCPALGKTSGKLNEVFYCAYTTNQDEAAGAQALMKKTGEILGLDIQYYVHADWTALVQAVNSVGGIDVTIESDDPRGIYDSSTGIKYANGEVAHLDGDKALALARARNHNYGDYGLAAGNYDREKNQQKILAALQQKAMSLGTILNPASLTGLIDSLGNNLITNFEASHVQTLADVASSIQMDKIKQLPLVGRDDGSPDLVGSYSPGGSYLGEAPVAGLYDYSDIQAYIAQNLSSDPVVREGAVIDVLNGSGQAGLASDAADELEDEGYTIGVVDNSPVPITDEIVIYQLNDDMTNTAQALADKYDVELVQGGLSGYLTDADFIVVVGPTEVVEAVY